MARAIKEPTSTMTLVLTLDQIAYIHKTASARGESLSEIGRELVQAGMEATVDGPEPMRCEAASPELSEVAAS